jgi:hypothetical protein
MSEMKGRCPVERDPQHSSHPLIRMTPPFWVYALEFCLLTG